MHMFTIYNTIGIKSHNIISFQKAGVKMFQMNENDIVGKPMDQQYKENYIAGMLVHTLYSNNVDISECYHIIKLFKEKVLGDVTI